MKRLSSITQRAINILSGAATGWVVVALMVLILVEVTARYVFLSPLAIADLIAPLMLVVIIFLGLAYTWRENGHIRIILLVNKLPEKVRNKLRLITLIIATLYVPIFIYAGYHIVQSSLRLGLKAEHWIRVPLIWPQLVLPIGFFMLFLFMIIDLIKTIKTFRGDKGR